MSISILNTHKNSSLPPSISPFPFPPIPSLGNGVLVTRPEIGKYYYYTILEEDTCLEDVDFSNLSFSYAGQYQGKKPVYGFDDLWHSFRNFADTDNCIYITPTNTGFYETNPEMEINCLPPAKEILVCDELQENRYYAVTDITKVIDAGDECDYLYKSIERPYYVGKHTGMWCEGWGANMKLRYHFSDRGKEVIIIPTPTTTFYRVNPPSVPGGTECTHPELPNIEYSDLVPFNISCCVFKKLMQ